MKIDFDIYMEERYLTSGTIPSSELPARENTTTIIEDVELMYKELEEVLLVVAARHGPEMVMEGRANISTTIDMMIFLPIEVFGINIYTFTIPITIESDVPVDIFKEQKEA
ncbi:MAG: hypothetical protein P1P80_00050 [ANME-2 cluster archaeon]|nr:hypothetical protein [ANME-2 cluster archaeon]